MQPSPAIGLSAIGQIALSVADAERSIAFYRDQLGMRLLFQVPQMGFFDCGGVRLMLSALEKPQGPSNSVIYFRVPEIQAAFGAMKQQGVAFEGEPHVVARMPDHDLWMAFFRDPDRNLLALMAEVPR
jgi:methylmalonyl-CoA/ethylmalonyl-CoA epimerase